jgi:hypothetical protein
MDSLLDQSLVIDRPLDYDTKAQLHGVATQSELSLDVALSGSSSHHVVNAPRPQLLDLITPVMEHDVVAVWRLLRAGAHQDQVNDQNQSALWLAVHALNQAVENGDEVLAACSRRIAGLLLRYNAKVHTPENSPADEAQLNLAHWGDLAVHFCLESPSGISAHDSSQQCPSPRVPLIVPQIAGNHTNSPGPIPLPVPILGNAVHDLPAFYRPERPSRSIREAKFWLPADLMIEPSRGSPSPFVSLSTEHAHAPIEHVSGSCCEPGLDSLRIDKRGPVELPPLASDGTAELLDASDTDSDRILPEEPDDEEDTRKLSSMHLPSLMGCQKDSLCKVSSASKFKTGHAFLLRTHSLEGSCPCLLQKTLIQRTGTSALDVDIPIAAQQCAIRLKMGS